MQGIIRMGINHLAEFGSLLKARTRTTPERVIRSSIYFIVSRFHGSIVSAHTLIRVIISKDMVEQDFFIIIHFLNLTIITI